jgi:23S rRNA pseudouridine2605 synthase
VRLNQYLARAGFGSRRACEELILEGAVTINGHRLRELATRVESGDNVLVHGKPVKLPLAIVAILHKPPGFLCTSSDSTKDRTIYDLLPTGWPRVVYVGRLDKESEGLLVVTNDGELSQRLTHPSTKIPKTYIVTINREFDFALAPKMLKGVALEDGFARMEELFRVGPRTMKVVLTQGLKRQIREMFYKFGYEVKRLVRIQIGQLTLGDLLPGQHRVLTQEEVRRYFPVKAPGQQARPPAKFKKPAPRPAERSEGSAPASSGGAKKLIARPARDNRMPKPRRAQKSKFFRAGRKGGHHG